MLCYVSSLYVYQRVSSALTIAWRWPTIVGPISIVTESPNSNMAPIGGANANVLDCKMALKAQESCKTAPR